MFQDFINDQINSEISLDQENLISSHSQNSISEKLTPEHEGHITVTGIKDLKDEKEPDKVDLNLSNDIKKENHRDEYLFIINIVLQAN